MQCQIKVDEEVKVYGFGMVKDESEHVGLFEGEKAIVKKINGYMITVSLVEADQPTLVDLHFFQVVPLNKDNHF